MSSLTSVQQIEFDSMVKAIYQSRGNLLRPTVRNRGGIVGSACEFRRINQVQAVLAGFSDYVNTQDPGFSPVVALLNKYQVGIPVDRIQELTVNFDVRREYAMILAMALGRRTDQIIIDALAAATPGYTVNATSGFTYAVLAQIAANFDAQAVPESERFLVIRASDNQNLMTTSDQIVSRLYTSNDGVVEGNINKKQIMGMRVVIIPTMAEGGLPQQVGTHSCFAYHMQSTGLAVGADEQTEINYIPQNTSYLATGLLYMGATVIDQTGVQLITVTDTE